MNRFDRSRINRANAAKSTGPVTATGKAAASLNGLKHGLTGQRMLFLPHELEPYRRLCDALNADYNPQTEIEKQLVQHIADATTRLNRIAAIESNMFSVGTVTLTREDAGNEAADGAFDIAAAQTVAQAHVWIKDADSFEKLGRYEARISRQLLKYMRELERIQNLRKRQAPESKADSPELASLRTESNTPESPAPNAPPKTMTAGSPTGPQLVKSVPGSAASSQPAPQTSIAHSEGETPDPPQTRGARD